MPASPVPAELPRRQPRDAAVGIEIRAVTDGELGAWVQVLDASFLLPVPDGAVAYFRQLYAPGRMLGAFRAGQCVGTLRSLDLEVTVPGGAAVPAEGITNVGVIPSQRRRGLLTRMMRGSLDAAVARGRSLAALIASEYRIYGRFGFGPATSTAGYDIDVRRAGEIRVPAAGTGHVDMLRLEEVGAYGPGLYERYRRTQTGALRRDQIAWRQRTGELRNPYREWAQPMAALYREADGTPAGLALYHVDDTWDGGDPDYTLYVDDLFAMRPAATAVLWRHLLSTEWVTRVRAANVAPDDTLPLLADNPRACMRRVGTGSDHLWLRILDVVGALHARTYDAPGRVILEIADHLGYAAGRYELAAGTDGGGAVTATSEPADLVLDISTLATAYLGDQTMHHLAAAGLVTERRAGALSLADRMLRTASRPWCSDGF